MLGNQLHLHKQKEGFYPPLIILGDYNKSLNTLPIGNNDILTYLTDNYNSFSPGRVYFFSDAASIFIFVNHSSGTQACLRLVKYNYGRMSFTYRFNMSTWSDWKDIAFVSQ